MAIIRCPYCHAIIDETDKYCNNCGTQLLFPDDESIEEEIPGEKIIEAESEEKNYELDEASKTGEALPHDEYEREAAGTVELSSVVNSDVETHTIEEILEGDETEEGAAEAKPHEATQEVLVVNEIAASEKEDRPERVQEAAPESHTEGEKTTAEFGHESVQETAESEAQGLQPAVPTEEHDYGGEVPPIERPIPVAEPKTAQETETGKPAQDTAVTDLTEPAAEPSPTGEAPAAEAGAAAASADSLTFDTNELEKIGETIDLSKARLDSVMDEMADSEQAAPASEAPVQEKTGTLPPWADRMKGAPSIISETDTHEGDEMDSARRSLLAKDLAAEETWPDSPKVEAAEETSEEEEIFPKRRDSDSGLGYPERLTQATLPFDSKLEEETVEELGAEVEPAAVVPPEPRPSPAAPAAPSAAVAARPAAGISRDEAFPRTETAAEEEEEVEKPPFSLVFFLKSKTFDILFIGFVWLIALWLAAQSLSTTLFDMLSITPWSAILFYAVLVLLYFFLFKFFLGETLGDRLFKDRD